MTNYKNSYSRPTPPTIAVHELQGSTPAEEYDHNFVFEVKELKSDRVELRPFIVS